MQSLRKTVWEFLKKLQKALPYDPAILFLGIYPDKTTIPKDTCTAMLIAAPFTIAKTWGQPKCPIDRWLDKEDVTYIYVYIWIQLNQKNNAICSNMDRPREYHTEVRKRKINTIWYHIYEESKIWHKWTYLQRRNRLRHRKHTCSCQRGGG